MAPNSAASRPSTRKQLRALVIDDENAVGRLLARQLGSRGFTVDVVHDAASALAAVKRQAYDLVLCDARLKGSSGLELYDGLSAARPNIGRSFVVISGDSIDPTVIDFASAKRVPLLGKPFTGAELDAAIARVLKGGRRAAERAIAEPEST